MSHLGGTGSLTALVSLTGDGHTLWRLASRTGHDGWVRPGRGRRWDVPDGWSAAADSWRAVDEAIASAPAQLRVWWQLAGAAADWGWWVRIIGQGQGWYLELTPPSGEPARSWWDGGDLIAQIGEVATSRLSETANE